MVENMGFFKLLRWCVYHFLFADHFYGAIIYEHEKEDGGSFNLSRPKFLLYYDTAF